MKKAIWGRAGEQTVQLKEEEVKRIAAVREFWGFLNMGIVRIQTRCHIQINSNQKYDAYFWD